MIPVLKKNTYSYRELLNQLGFNNDLNGISAHSQGVDDDEDLGEEQISSALFLPHQMAQEAAERPRERFDSSSGSIHTHNITRSEEWLEEHIISTPEKKNIYKIEEMKPISSITGETFISTGSSGKLGTHHDSHDDLTSKTGRLEFQNKDEETTPTGSPRLVSLDPEESNKYSQDLLPAPKKPLDAIELIPYSHQVGGHTTLWRFSKRAVCKQLNNRENEFYEKIEQYYPQLLQFLPRYIGVLNVTFEKQNSRGPLQKDILEAGFERINATKENSIIEIQGKYGIVHDKELLGNCQSENRRTISQSCAFSQPQSVPTVTFADNRHIIPTSILKPIPILSRNQSRSLSESASFSKIVGSNSNSGKINFNIPGTSAEPNPWGKTHVNKVLRDDVFKEVFLQKPIPIRHKRPATHLISQFRNNNSLRNSNSESNLQTVQKVTSNTESSQGKDLNIIKDGKVSKQIVASRDIPASDDSIHCISESFCHNNLIERNLPESEMTYTDHNSSGKRQRRYSSGGLRRRPAEVADDRGILKYFQEAGDAVYEGNTNDDFLIENEVIEKNLTIAEKTSFAVENNRSSSELSTSEVEGPYNHLISSQNIVTPQLEATVEVPRPVNPKEARAQPGSRVEYFLLLEDLTAGMKRPCIMDLKMGTRQYGVDANQDKQKSQRDKCAATTSKRLGVRVCGLQVWDVSLQEYIFEDKYYGRDLKAGKGFLKALTRFLYDGVDYSSVLRHIPSILQRLSELEILIHGLIGYRFYGTSLLMFYDGATEEEYSSDSITTGKEDRDFSRDIDFKIADFANCVTMDDFNTSKRRCPPQHPKKPDMGFLKGLKTLKRYFLEIEREIKKDKGFVDFQSAQFSKGLYDLDDFHDNDDDIDDGDVSN